MNKKHNLFLSAICAVAFFILPPAYAQTVCLGHDCDSTGGGGTGSDGGTWNPTERFGNLMYDYAITNALQNGSLDPDRRQCFADCFSDYNLNMQLCIDTTPTPFGTSNNQEALEICQSVMRERYIQCLGVTGFGDCVEQF